MKLLVVGAGEMGTWFARTVARELADPPELALADADDAVADAAADELDGRVVTADADERFDVVCLAVPIPAVDDAAETWGGRADRAVLDVTGVMEPAVAAMAAAAPDTERVSVHPLFAADSAPGNVAVVADEPGPVTDRIRAAIAAAGNDCFETTAAEHDEAMETVQARVHAAVLAFGLAAEEVSEPFRTPASAAMFDLLDQVTGNDPRVYSDIQTAFEGADGVAGAARELADADAEAFADLYREAGRDR
ncbi:prephenate dehydrogenase [Halobacteriales archaeon QS_5_68_33]|nr:MAG: prephenate dehydrogenase [Halobacteriales archaeon QS_5_68_33]